MLRNALTLTAAVAALLTPVLSSAPARADDYPSRPIEVIATFGAGGGADLMARQFARLAEPHLHVAMPVVNVSGASGNAGLTRVLTNPADGYTVGTLIALSVSSWASGLGTAKPDNFAYVAMMQNSPSMLYVSKNSPFKTYEDFAAHAKANPGKLRVATSGYGTQDDITLKYLGSQGVPVTNVPFARPSERYASPIGGHTDAIYEEPGDVAQFLKSGDLRPIVVFDKQRHPSFPDVPASAELGLDIGDLPNFRTLAVPASTPPERVQKLHEAAAKVLASPEWKTFCADTFTCVDTLVTPDQAKEEVKAFYETVKGYLDRFATKTVGQTPG
ncbi:Bug family tripartite tricarboxylate transporter substrate binding protein [Azospirillum argentinense]|uniref:Bug family tripartite tricarboxylate transporter substrate binding protein n=1 Tax=Azospirillum argentinense TaxID=2970906 RepID=A0ABW8VCE6_9PROT